MGITADELKRIALQNAELLWEHSSDGHILLDNRGTFVLVNREVEEKTNFSREELIGKKFFEVRLLTLASKELVLKNFAARMLGKKIPPYEIEALSKFGEKLHYEINATPVLKDGKAVGEYIILRDLTERKKLEAALRSEIKQFQELVLHNASDFRLELGSLQACLADLEKNSRATEKEKLREAIQLAGELDLLFRRLVQKISK